MRIFRKNVTLIELILVMVILVLITGLVVTLYPNLRAQARIVNTIATIDELDKAIRTHEALEGKFPDDFDSIVTSGAGSLVSLRSGVDGPLLSASVIGGASGIASTILGVPDIDLITALSVAGLSKLFDNITTIPSATFDFIAVAPNPETIASTTAITILTDPSTSAPAYGIIPAPAPVVYLILGIGPNTTFVGSTPGISSAPLHESYVESENDYDAFYGRYIAIFELKSTAGVMDPIRFVKVASPSSLPGGFGGTIENYKVVYDSF